MKQQQTMKELWSDREAYRMEREQARARMDGYAFRHLTAKIGNCTAKMNRLLIANIDRQIALDKAGQKNA